ncbi:MAG: molybdopterin biosynthesis-like protein MoeZ [Candidatus Methanofastidiosum methylothiophilum]|jgi:rhodanese-related sulfurtransferase|uniref:Molybdopterin biosynthesis-like protein MoeZ n=1 Tax=Candidatus Methanofastidiosum methylothiophilum TaxID=1705564 RepID=A0A150JIB1_9EURY|nr:MAG: molybdopterin biosynthesis-like protein MoeZ [Candidatus Methanofastidiosum methylthiophilus]MBP6932992.1 rhodanese-like domain-containing protein [Methanofastidiosum sp.]OQC51728.1 MAG: molybdopterin biosynthesis-like protein MoeZ [Euryarchaeota archaeon ADurb.Bin023]KYC56025.1 MAG: molybdopterin biosynthesis-like protein MoeZ [Candidatus Methanofastidiosum methylthiophilus]KYC56911.1 MAG: molybdopterin biosynthesis-like protein MoeZ [Candidatus Methanofastidiosum methylthiophilus]
MRKKYIPLIILLVISIGLAPGVIAQEKTAIIANSIDSAMNPNFIPTLKKANIAVDFFNAEDTGYKTYDYIIILGGPDATEHIGAISGRILLELDQDKLRAGGFRLIYEANDTFKSKQKVFIIAGSNRNFTKMAVDQYTPRIISKITGQPIKTGSYTSLKASQVKQLIDSKESIYLIDVRPKGQFAESHIQGAVNIPLEELSFKINQIPKDKKIVLYCSSGIKSANGAQFLVDLGFKNVYAMSEGYSVYSNMAK